MCSFGDQMNYTVIGVAIGIIVVTFWVYVAWRLTGHE
jgi:hypothetical protein